MISSLSSSSKDISIPPCLNNTLKAYEIQYV
nr:MAG TPA: hypothetical protein [Caudoviricetes sp.]